MKKLLSFLLLGVFFFSVGSPAFAQSEMKVSYENYEQEMKEFEKNMRTYKNTVESLTRNRKRDAEQIEVELFLLQRNLLEKYEKLFGNAYQKGTKGLQDMIDAITKPSKSVSKTQGSLTLKDTKNFSYKFDFSNQAQGESDGKGNTHGKGQLDIQGNNNTSTYPIAVTIGYEAYSAFKNGVTDLFLKLPVFNANFPEKTPTPNPQASNMEMGVYQVLNMLSGVIAMGQDKIEELKTGFYKADSLGYLLKNGGVESSGRLSDIMEYKKLRDLLQQTKILTVYKVRDGNDGAKTYYFTLNPEFVEKVFKAYDINLLEGLGNGQKSFIAQMERKHYNMVSRNPNGVFKYSLVDKEKPRVKRGAKNYGETPDQPKTTILYLEFTKETLISFFLHAQDKSKFFLNKDTFKMVSGDGSSRLLFHLNDNELKGKYTKKDNEGNDFSVILYGDKGMRNIYLSGGGIFKTYTKINFNGFQKGFKGKDHVLSMNASITSLNPNGTDNFKASGKFQSQYRIGKGLINLKLDWMSPSEGGATLKLDSAYKMVEAPGLKIQIPHPAGSF